MERLVPQDSMSACVGGSAASTMVRVAWMGCEAESPLGFDRIQDQHKSQAVDGQEAPMILPWPEVGVEGREALNKVQQNLGWKDAGIFLLVV